MTTSTTYGARDRPARDGVRVTRLNVRSTAAAAGRSYLHGRVHGMQGARPMHDRRIPACLLRLERRLKLELRWIEAESLQRVLRLRQVQAPAQVGITRVEDGVDLSYLAV